MKRVIQSDNTINKLGLMGVIVFLLVLAGCTGGSRDKSPITDIDVRKGTDGLNMEFTKNAPPERVFEDSIFPIALRIRNKGAFDVGDEFFDFDEEKQKSGILVFGFEKTYLDVSDLEILEDFRKLSDQELNELKNELVIFLTEIIKGDYIEVPERLSENEKVSLGILSGSYVDILLSKELGQLSSQELEGLPIENTLNTINNELKEDIKIFSIDEKKIIIIGGLKSFHTALIGLIKEVIGRKEFNITGKSIFNPNGDEKFITINAETKKIGAQSETQPSTILATACYPYKTIFGTSVCIDTDIYGERRGKKVCDITDLRFGGGQGAPVAITKIETRMLPQDDNLVKPHFLIFIENKGNGEVLSLGKVEEACTSQALDYKDFNTIIIKASLSGKPLDCRINKEGPEPAVIRLRDKENLVRCTLKGPKDELIDISKEAYIAPLSIELDYGYTFTISKDIIIEKILTY